MQASVSITMWRWRRWRPGWLARGPWCWTGECPKTYVYVFSLPGWYWCSLLAWAFFDSMPQLRACRMAEACCKYEQGRTPRKWGPGHSLERGHPLHFPPPVCSTESRSHWYPLDPMSVPHDFEMPEQLRSIDLLSHCVPEQSMPLCFTQVLVY